ncbi:MAG: hypothetical protein H0V66_12810 [Bdellovibrionales bacterium]|nr:hypothetical protein [Bdellovibrionales bacterium]
MIKLEKIMELRQPYISAASGLVLLDDKFFVVSDDENFIGIFDTNFQTSVSLPIFSEVLPEEAKLRKSMKNDFEALVHLPLQKQLLLIPSGSTLKRGRGAVVNERGELLREISFQSLYSQLRKDFPELNIEGAIIQDEEIWLFQRGNGAQNKNAIISFNLNDFLKATTVTYKIKLIDLGAVENVNYSFTDATKSDKNILFLAVAENSSSTYLDGQVLGTKLGLMNASGEILAMTALETTSKSEGICFHPQSQHFYVVTDDDNRHLPSTLYRGRLPTDWKDL